MKANELLIGMRVTRFGSEGLVTGRTPRTVTIKYPFSTSKYTFKKDASLTDLGVALKSDKI